MEIKKLTDIEGYESFEGYEICSNGDLLSYWINTNGNNRKSYLSDNYNKLTICLDDKGYVRNRIGGRNNYHKYIRRHILVAKAFINNPNHYTQVNHKDGNKINNHINNLEWCNNSMNQIHAIQTGLRQLKYNEDQIKIMCENWNNYDKKELSKLCGINYGSMYDIYTGKAIMYQKIVSKYK